VRELHVMTFAERMAAPSRRGVLCGAFRKRKLTHLRGTATCKLLIRKGKAAVHEVAYLMHAGGAQAHGWRPVRPLQAVAISTLAGVVEGERHNGEGLS